MVSLIIYESGTGIDTLQKKQNVASSMSGDDMIIYQYETKLSETKWLYHEVILCILQIYSNLIIFYTTNNSIHKG